MVWSVALPEQRLIYVSSAVAQVYGLTPREALAAPDSWFDTIHAEDSSIVSAILSLTHALGLKAVAEGVESDEQAELLLRTPG